MTEDDFYSAAIWAIVCGMLGSKITYWIVEFDRVIADPHFLLETLTAGFVFYGSLIGGALGVLIFALHKKQNVLVYVDLFSPAMALGQAFGRIRRAEQLLPCRDLSRRRWFRRARRRAAAAHAAV